MNLVVDEGELYILAAFKKVYVLELAAVLSVNFDQVDLIWVYL